MAQAAKLAEEASPLNFGDHFALTRIINLADRTDRRREMQRQLDSLGTPIAPGKVEFFAATRLADAAGFPSPGVRGCFISHLAILKDARSRNAANVLILEDDLEILPRNLPLLETILAQLPTLPWQLLYLGHVLPTDILPATSGEPRLEPYAGNLQTSHFYAVRSDAYDPLIDYLEACLIRPPGDPIGGPMHLDGALTMFRAANPQVLTLVAQPSLGSQRSSRSDISYRAIEQLPILKQTMSLARTLRRALR